MSDESPDASISVMVVDDNPVVRSGLVSLLEASGVGTVVAEAGDGQEAVTAAEKSRPDVVLLDVRMPRIDGVEAAGVLSQNASVVMLTYTEDPEVIQSAIRNGACGYLIHGTFTPEELAKAIHDATTGAHPLSTSATGALLDAVRQTPQNFSVQEPVPDPSLARLRLDLSEREAEILKLIAEGQTNTEIAETLFLSEKTVKNHVNRIYTKLGVGSRGAAIARWHAALIPRDHRASGAYDA